MFVAVDGLLFGHVAEYRFVETIAEIVGDAFLPRSVHDLSRQASRGAHPGHEVISEPIPVSDQLVARHHLVHETVFEGLVGVGTSPMNRAGSRALGDQELLELTVDAVEGHRAVVLVQVEDDRTLRG